MTTEAAPKQYLKPLPRPGQDTQPFWDSAKEHNLKVQRCTACGTYRHYPRPMCSKCWSLDVEWAPISGKGTVYTWVTAHQPFNPTFAEDVPYASVVIDLPEGIRMMTNVVTEEKDGSFKLYPHEQLKIGMPVTLVYDDVTPDFTLPKWKPA